MRPGESTPKIEARIQELETKAGVTKNDDPLYEKLTPMQWLYTLEIVANGWIPNKKQFAEEFSINRDTVYGYAANKHVMKAIRSLDSITIKLPLREVEQVALEKAKAGDHRWAKLLFDRYPPDNQGGGTPEIDQADTWDLSLAKSPESLSKTPKTDTPPN